MNVEKLSKNSDLRITIVLSMNCRLFNRIPVLFSRFSRGYRSCDNDNKSTYTHIYTHAHISKSEIIILCEFFFSHIEHSNSLPHGYIYECIFIYYICVFIRIYIYKIWSYVHHCVYAGRSYSSYQFIELFIHMNMYMHMVYVLCKYIFIWLVCLYGQFSVYNQ